MKKKLCLILTLVIFTALAVIPFAACTGDNGNSGSGNSEYALQTDKKYIRDDDTNKTAYEQNYVLFRADGTGERRCYYIYNGEEDSKYNEDYTIKFKYTYVDSDKSAVVCLFDSVEYGKKHPAGGDKVSSDWTALYTVSKNVCAAGGSGYTFFINEDYLKQLPNFGK